MKKIILTTAILFATVALSMAQNGDRNFRRNENRPNKAVLDAVQNKTPEERAQHQVDRMKQTLGLNDQQTKALYDLNLNREKKRNEEWQKRREKIEANKAKQEQMKAKFQQIRKERNTEMNAYHEQLEKILDKDQLAKLEQMKTERKEKMKERMHNRIKSSKNNTPKI